MLSEMMGYVQGLENVVPEILRGGTVTGGHVRSLERGVNQEDNI
jgi:uncharacterized protein YheU (UPF0270 family)